MEGMNKLPNTHIYLLIPSRSRSGRITDAKTGPKLSEQWSWKALRHDVRELVRGRHMEDPDLTQGHLLTDEVDANLDVLCAPDWLSCILHSHYHSRQQWPKQAGHEAPGEVGAASNIRPQHEP